MIHLGELAKLYRDVGDRCRGEHKRVLQDILVRMASIDSDITKSMYGGPRDGSADRPLIGDDYNDLWDALLDAIHASMYRS